MTGLLIEDDPSKSQKISTFISETFQDIQLSICGSYQSGLKTIFERQFDFILLDMSIPTYDQIEGNFSGKPRNYGGRDIMKEMKRYKKESLVKVITQYNDFDGGTISIKELDEQLIASFPNIYRGYIYYSSKQQDWEEALTQFLTEIR